MPKRLEFCGGAGSFETQVVEGGEAFLEGGDCCTFLGNVWVKGIPQSTLPVLCVVADSLAMPREAGCETFVGSRADVFTSTAFALLECRTLSARLEPDTDDCAADMTREGASECVTKLSLGPGAREGFTLYTTPEWCG